MMFSLKLCAKKRFQPFIKLLLIIAIIGIYFIVLLRESFAAWELTKIKNTNINSANEVGPTGISLCTHLIVISN